MSTPDEIAQNEVAQTSAARMWAADVASRELGMRLDEVRPGYARLTMTVTAIMVQGHGIGHGGYVFTLADSAFAFACNSYGPTAVAAHCDISFLRPSPPATSWAEAVERTSGTAATASTTSPSAGSPTAPWSPSSAASRGPSRNDHVH